MADIDFGQLSEAMIGKRFGRLVVLDYAGTNKHQKRCYKCKCDCGNVCVVCGCELRKGHTRSCGCLHKEKIAKGNPKHNHNSSRLQPIWAEMKQRCCNPNNKSYTNYGGRGIKVCSEWLNDFNAFFNWAMANGYDKKANRSECTLDRIDNNGNYCPENCRWAKASVQSRNTRRTHNISMNGKTQCMMDWCIELNLPYDTVRSRINKLGWNPQKALTIKIRSK